jgi:energy-converting hydrogenase Eha subunit G
MAFLKALFISTLLSAGSFLVGAVALSILNIYMAGHGMDWFNKPLESESIDMSPLTLILALIVFTVFITSFTISFRIARIKQRK